MSVPDVIRHNPGCGTLRIDLAILRAAGSAPVVIDDLAQGWTRPHLQDLLAKGKRLA
ncbi:hypothetical protein [Szabonella alba]|uniref:Arsenate reductase n=1 Tax=Szabonella alba TaxID=2804194 RepID=A0A8K0Y0J9_9RHOB|nr:hypothetical protein [Szabonella alba]MBL4916922.1 hypothetical protein [Szabonella alba]